MREAQAAVGIVDVLVFRVSDPRSAPSYHWTRTWSSLYSVREGQSKMACALPKDLIRSPAVLFLSSPHVTPSIPSSLNQTIQE